MQSTQSKTLHVQFVHSGPTHCIHAPKSANVDRLFTGGDDYLVRILPTLPLSDVEPQLIEDATEAVTSLDADGRFLVTASEDGSVRLYRHHPIDAEGNPASPTVLQSLLRREAWHWPSFYNVVTGKTLALPNLIALQHIPLSPVAAACMGEGILHMDFDPYSNSFSLA